MQKFILPLHLAALLVCPLAVAAEAPASATSPLAATSPLRALSLSAAVQRALAANREISAARHGLDVSAGALLQAGLRPNPELGITVEDAGRADNRSTTVQITQALELAGKRPARIALAQSEAAIANNELAIKAAEIRATATRGFFDVLIAEERRRLARHSFDLARKVRETTAKQVASGKISAIEETKAGVAESGIRIELSQADSALLAARQRLAANWGARQADDFELSGSFDDLPELPSMVALSERLRAAATMQRVRLAVEQGQANLQLERSRRIPDLSVSLGAKREAETGRQQALVAIAIPLPWSDRNQGNVQQASARLNQARDQLAVSESLLYSQLQQIHQRLSVALDEHSLLEREILPGAQRAFEMTLKGFEYGKFNFIDVSDAQRSLLLAQAQHLRSLSDAHQAASEIESLLADPALSLYSTMQTKDTL
ncbi:MULTISPECIES: TolC family protein [unclassified Undibacterium]|uniref:TolC family protein n=1 Tax=unclassified Undibacterium TaxID=2630295 RepID=UPI002AC9530B|nr:MULTISPECIES: TolC family protein [unclassified Undibacterium]MEB0139685.1 TolC family protein [Undibacterium sp. CCC2.1]MEB0172566.1 TolC family protein [Undibacterium sp. CCC1.1]MEB0176338.1 TolC family protein [Undibacterium sp. CCC3.4]MEB0215672.1 TolC family protein [Undibacterium sp. 5I2]WPX42950.1 TolC family protein [Undibacterium sp. CCC3.4]